MKKKKKAENKDRHLLEVFKKEVGLKTTSKVVTMTIDRAKTFYPQTIEVEETLT